MNLVIEVREVVFEGPLADLIGRPIGVAVVVVVVLVPLVEPPLVLALELVVEDDPFDVGAAFQETRLCLFVGAIDLQVVFEFPLTRQARVEGLVMVSIEVSMAFEKAAAVLGQADCMIAVPRHSRRIDQPLFAEVPEIAGAWVSRAAVVVTQITTGDHSKRADGRERSRFRAAQGVLAIAVPNQLAFRSTRQAHVARERVAGLPIAFTTVAIAVRPTRIVVAAARVLIGPLPFITRTASERPYVITIAVARARLRLAPVVITIAIAGAAAASTARRVWLPLVVVRIAVARVEVKHCDLRTICPRRSRARTAAM